MRRATLAVAFLLVLVGCGSSAFGPSAPPPAPNGIVTRLYYDDPDPGSIPYSCTKLNWEGELETKTCYRDDPAHWWVHITNEQDVIFRVETTEQIFDSCRLGARWAPGTQSCIG